MKTINEYSEVARSLIFEEYKNLNTTNSIGRNQRNWVDLFDALADKLLLALEVSRLSKIKNRVVFRRQRTSRVYLQKS